MRHHIEHLKSSAMDWEALSPGVYAKFLNHNKQTGDRTALFRFVPAEGANPPNICHYHSVFEEIFMLSGRMTFDHKTWLGKYGYVFHPPFAVHGFNSAIPAETVFIGRAPAELDFNYPDPPQQKEPYYIKGNPVTRELVYLNPPPEEDWEPMLSPDGVEMGQQLILSQDRVTGEGSSLMRFMEGFELSARKSGYETFNEGYILEGEIEAENGLIWGPGDYWHRHAKSPIPTISINKSTLLFSSRG